MKAQRRFPKCSVEFSILGDRVFLSFMSVLMIYLRMWPETPCAPESSTTVGAQKAATTAVSIPATVLLGLPAGLTP